MSVKKKLGFVAVFALAAAANVGLIAHGLIADADRTPVVGEDIIADAELQRVHQNEVLAATGAYDASYAPTLTNAEHCIKTFTDDFFQAVYRDAESGHYVTVTGTDMYPLTVDTARDPLSWDVCNDLPYSPVAVTETEDLQPWFVQLIFPKEQTPAV